MPPIQPIRTERLVLREFTMDDWPAVHRYGSDPEVMRYMMIRPYTEQQSRDFVEAEIARQAQEPRENYDLAVVLTATKELIGSAGIRMIWPKQREASMGYILRRDCWGRGYATEAAIEILRLGFERMGAHRIVASCDVDNLASARVAEKLGMTREGLGRQNFWSPAHNGWRDTYFNAILEDEWKARHR